MRNNRPSEQVNEYTRIIFDEVQPAFAKLAEAVGLVTFSQPVGNALFTKDEISDEGGDDE